MRRAEILAVPFALVAVLAAVALAPEAPSADRSAPTAPAAERPRPEPPPTSAPERTVDPATDGAEATGGHRRLVARSSSGGCCKLCREPGLLWLSTHQSEDGFWDADGFTSRCKLLPVCAGRGAADMDTAVTGLSLLAFLGAGHTHKAGQYKTVVKDALRHLKSIQEEDGSFAIGRDRRAMLNHSIASLAMCEAYALTKSILFKQSAQSAVDRIEAIRPEECDAAVATWAVLALASAKAAGLVVDSERLEEAGRWFEGDPYAHFGLEIDATTAAGLLCRGVAGGKVAAKDAAPLVRAVREGRAESFDHATWCFGTLACYRIGGEVWKAWHPAIKAHVLPAQKTKGDERGSWDPDGVLGEDLGRVGVTALMLTTQQVYYRYSKVFATR